MLQYFCCRGNSLESPYAARENGQRISAKYLAQRLRAFGREWPTLAAAPGSVVGLRGAELEEFAGLLEPNFSGDIERIYVPYGNDIPQYPTEDPSGAPWKIAILLRGVVEVQAPFHGGPIPNTPNLYPVTIISAPALIWMFEAIPETDMQRHHVRILSGVQSFSVLLSLSQLQPWRQIAKRSSTSIPYGELKISSALHEPKHTSLFKWSRRWQRAPTFTSIADCGSNEWSTELAFIDVGPILTKSYNELSETQRHFREALYRNAMHRFGDSLRRHVPGYRPVLPLAGSAGADNLHTVASFMTEIYVGQQPHHTCCFNFEQASNLFPAKTLTWNIYDFVRLAVGQNVLLSKFASPRRSTIDQLDYEVMVRFFDNFLYRWIYVPSFSAASDVCLYSPILWGHDDMNMVLRSFDPRQAAKLQSVFSDIQKRTIHDFHIKSVPAFFKGTSEFGGGVPKSISEIIMDGGLFFRKISS